ncbi:MAG: type II toxin-antitoxin system RelE/ParE family toxin [Saprospiraceae bacterium]|nr:type II toxin-antitoxin system RelE/ParE family toxin [Saprospiraceae bacterium]
MASKIKWSKQADKTFDSIIEYLEKEWGEKVTRAFVKKTYEFFDLLIDFPEIGSIENEARNIRGFVIVKQITIFYKFKGDDIIILNFYDNRQRFNKKRYGR